MKVRIFISGFVQGVGFRQFVKKNAQKIGLKGWIRNLTDGRVEGVFIGSKDKIEEIIQLCSKGPFLAEVKKVDVMWQGSYMIEEMSQAFEIV